MRTQASRSSENAGTRPGQGSEVTITKRPESVHNATQTEGGIPSLSPAEAPMGPSALKRAANAAEIATKSVVESSVTNPEDYAKGFLNSVQNKLIETPWMADYIRRRLEAGEPQFDILSTYIAYANNPFVRNTQQLTSRMSRFEAGFHQVDLATITKVAINNSGGFLGGPRIRMRFPASSCLASCTLELRSMRNKTAVLG